MSDVKILCTTDEAIASPTSEALEQRMFAIRNRAYELFLARGDNEGSETDDWIAAEREILGLAAAEVTEVDGAYDVDMTLPGFDANDLEITATETEVIVRAAQKADLRGREKNIVWREFGANDVYRRFTLPTPVSTERISARLHDGVLHLHAPKSPQMTHDEKMLAPA